MVTAEVSEQTTRLEAFSDGIFAIAMTLLVLEIRLPEQVPARNARNCAAASVAIVSGFSDELRDHRVMWVNHHRIFNLIRRTDQAILAFKSAADVRRVRFCVSDAGGGATHSRLRMPGRPPCFSTECLRVSRSPGHFSGST